MRLGHARSDGAHADLRDELHRDARRRVDVLEVVDELREVLDRVDVVMGRRRNQGDSRRRVPDPRDHLVHLVPRQLSALAGLGALRDLDLQFVGVDEVVGRDAEAPRCHLLDRRAPPVAARIARVALFVLPPFARVRAPADPVHRDCQRLVRLAGDRAERHRAGGEPLDDRRGGFRPPRAGAAGRPT